MITKNTEDQGGKIASALLWINEKHPSFKLLLAVAPGAIILLIPQVRSWWEKKSTLIKIILTVTPGLLFLVALKRVEKQAKAKENI